MPPSPTARRAIQYRNQYLHRATRDPLDPIRTLTVYYTAPTSHLALVARVKGYVVEDLDALLAAREIVAMAGPRGSGYLVATGHVPVVVAATTGRRKRVEKEILGRAVDVKVYARLARRIEKTLAGAEMSATDLKKAVRPREGEETDAFSSVVRLMSDDCRIVRSRTVGTWRSNKAVYRLWEEWLPEVDPFQMSEQDGCAELARLYFAAHGPATLEDFRWWSGITSDPARLVEASGVPRLDDRWFGRARRAAPPKGVRLVPYWDGAFLTHRDRSHVVPDDLYGMVYDSSGNPAPVVLVDGRARGVWTMTEEKSKVVVRAAPFKSFSGSVWSAIETEAAGIAEAVGATDIELVRVGDPPRITGGPWNLFMSPLRDRS